MESLRPVLALLRGLGCPQWRGESRQEQEHQQGQRHGGEQVEQHGAAFPADAAVATAAPCRCRRARARAGSAAGESRRGRRRSWSADPVRTAARPSERNWRRSATTRASRGDSLSASLSTSMPTENTLPGSRPKMLPYCRYTTTGRARVSGSRSNAGGLPQPGRRRRCSQRAPISPVRASVSQKGKCGACNKVAHSTWSAR